MSAQNCIFCKIVKGEIPAAKIYENGQIFAFLDIMPATKGHSLVVPKEHYESAAVTPSSILMQMIEAAKKVGRSQSQALGATGYNLLINTGRDAGQVVFHTHLHVIPRHANDGLIIKWDHRKYQEGELSDHQEKLRRFMS